MNILKRRRHHQRVDKQNRKLFCEKASKSSFVINKKGKNFFLNTKISFVSFSLITKTTKQSKKGGARLPLAWKKQEAQRTGFFLLFEHRKATEKFLFVSFLFFLSAPVDCHSQAYIQTHTHTHNTAEWSNVRSWACVKRKQISQCFAFLLVVWETLIWAQARIFSLLPEWKTKNIIKYLSSLKWVGRTCFVELRVDLFSLVCSGEQKKEKWKEKYCEVSH